MDDKLTVDGLRIIFENDINRYRQFLTEHGLDAELPRLEELESLITRVFKEMELHRETWMKLSEEEGCHPGLKTFAEKVTDNVLQMYHTTIREILDGFLFDASLSLGKEK